ncbi:tripartite tricarboxylate transporter permease [Hyphomicrobium sp. LHD-15]|uniref:tripartite tricarboxylate transporter permease n=1 Tax=Hyphomicrobium sp. LHD-15 TaxID=3072142 RepID=UPI0028108468|nr:tripartite tricarboxylate transporter permease [Hyphomicrobium sp. LHD-15]MDQ8697371.1 tripartite tricarboxylate transporter permease [Hyphomicrobium sp. LHD-15]
MIELLNHLVFGLAVAVSPTNVLLCLAGCFLGTLIGVLPGIGSIATISMLLPLTYGLDPVGALIMLAGIYYGAQYGGSTASILVNVPGEATSIITAIDGHQMARQGRAGVALGISAIGSFIAGTISTVFIAALAIPLTRVALEFGPADYFSLLLMGVLASALLSRGAVSKSVAMILLGMLLATVGMDLETAAPRLTLGYPQLMEQIPFAVLAMGAFGLAELGRSLETPENRDVISRQIGGLLPSLSDLKQSAAPILRGTAIGGFLGVLPGNGALLGPVASYGVEKHLAKEPQRFGKGAIEGVAGPESANNAAAQTSFIPLLTLGVPANAVMALMLGAMTMNGIVAGPQVIERSPEFFWGMIASMWIGNLMLLVINLPMIGIWVKLLKVPFRILMPSIVVFCAIGAYSMRNEPFDVALAGFFAVGGYLLIKLGFEPTPLLLGFVIGDMMEEKLRQALIMSRGSLAIFIEQPISAGLLALTLVLLSVLLLPRVRRKRDEVIVE